MTIGKLQIVIMPFWENYSKSGCNYNGVDIFDSYQIGYIEIRKYKSIEYVWPENFLGITISKKCSKL